MLLQRAPYLCFIRKGKPKSTRYRLIHTTYRPLVLFLQAWTHWQSLQEVLDLFPLKLLPLSHHPIAHSLFPRRHHRFHGQLFRTSLAHSSCRSGVKGLGGRRPAHAGSASPWTTARSANSSSRNSWLNRLRTNTRGLGVFAKAARRSRARSGSKWCVIPRTR